MFNPFAVFEPRFLEAFKQKGVKAFVRQTYNRGRNLLEQEPAPSYLLIHFNDENKAREHFEAIQTDAGRQLYKVDEPADFRQLHTLLNQPQGQRFYTILTIPNVNQKAKKILDKKIRYYIDHKTGWHPRSYEEVSFSFEIIFGEIYVRLVYGPKHVKLKLDEFENI
jgi:hypothetical protein